MVRYSGQPLPRSPRIAVVANDAIGNFVVSTPLLQMLRAAHAPASLDYYGGTRTWELIQASDLIDHGVPLHGLEPKHIARALAEERPYDLVFNQEATATAKFAAAALAGENGYVCGPSVGPGGRGDLPFSEDERGRLWADPKWIASDLRGRYPILGSPHIAEIFCRLAWLEGPVPGYRVPQEDPRRTVPETLVAAAASLSDKLWPFEKWRDTLASLPSKAGLLGAPPAKQKEFWKGDDAEQRLVDEGLVEDLRGAFSLPQVVGALARARRVLTLDNGIMHLACAAGTPTVALFRHGIHRLWAPPQGRLVPVVAQEGKDVASIPTSEVVGALAQLR